MLNGTAATVHTPEHGTARGANLLLLNTATENADISVSMIITMKTVNVFRIRDLAQLAETSLNTPNGSTVTPSPRPGTVTAGLLKTKLLNMVTANAVTDALKTTSGTILLVSTRATAIRAIR